MILLWKLNVVSETAGWTVCWIQVPSSRNRSPCDVAFSSNFRLILGNLRPFIILLARLKLLMLLETFWFRIYKEIKGGSEEMEIKSIRNSPFLAQIESTFFNTACIHFKLPRHKSIEIYWNRWFRSLPTHKISGLKNRRSNTRKDGRHWVSRKHEGVIWISLKWG